MMDKLERVWYRMSPISRAIVFGAGVATLTTFAFGVGVIVAAVKVKQQLSDESQGDSKLPELPEIPEFPEE